MARLGRLLGVTAAATGLIGLLLAGASRADTDCSGFPNHSQDGRYAAWIADSGVRNQMAMIDWRNGTTTPKVYGDPVNPGYVLRGELHICVPDTKTSYAGKIQFKDPGFQPQWNDHDFHQVISANSDNYISKFWQVVPNELGQHIDFTPKINDGLNQVFPVVGDPDPTIELVVQGTAIDRPTTVNGPAATGDCPRNSFGHAMVTIAVATVNSCPAGGCPSGYPQLGDILTSPVHLVHGYDIQFKIDVCIWKDYAANTLPVGPKLIQDDPTKRLVAWEDAPFAKNALVGGQILHDTTTFYQDVPSEVDTMTLVPRIFSSQGALPDDNVLAQGPAFIVYSDG